MESSICHDGVSEIWCANLGKEGKARSRNQKPSFPFAWWIRIGPSGVRALPLATGRNESGHYLHYKTITVLFREYNRTLPAI